MLKCPYLLDYYLLYARHPINKATSAQGGFLVFKHNLVVDLPKTWIMDFD
jgi:hypothetical protein